MDNCAINKQSCIDFVNLKKHFLKLVLSSEMYSNHIRKVQKKLRTTNCPFIVTEKQDPQQVCIKRNICYVKQKSNIQRLDSLKRIDCPCEKQCNNVFCGMHIKFCDSFDLELQKSATKMDEFYKCGH